MPYNKYIHNRRSIRLKGYDYSQSGLYFVTICTKDRINLLGEILGDEMVLNDYGVIVKKQLIGLLDYFPNIKIDTFCIMPNHIHAIIVIENDLNNDINSTNIADNLFIRANLYSPLHVDITNDTPKPRIKGTSKTIGSMVRALKINVAKELGFTIFQRNYHEHIIRNQTSHETITQYIQQNPANWQKDSLR